MTADGVILAALTFEFADSIDVERAEKAKENAERKIAAAADEREANLARARLERALTRLKVAKM